MKDLDSDFTVELLMLLLQNDWFAAKLRPVVHLSLKMDAVAVYMYTPMSHVNTAGLKT